MKRTLLINNKGFSLLEIMIAMVVFLFGVLAVGTVLLGAIKVNAQARLMTNGSVEARSQLERLLAMDFDHASLQDIDGDADPSLGGTLGSGLADTTFDNNPGTRGDADYGPFPDTGDLRIYWNVAEDWPIKNIKSVHVLVRWRDRGVWKQTSYEGIKSTAL